MQLKRPVNLTQQPKLAFEESWSNVWEIESYVLSALPPLVYSSNDLPAHETSVIGQQC
jgi:hypothetical protein